MKWRRGRGDAGRLGAEDVLLLATVVAFPWFWGGVLIGSYRTAAAVVALAAGWALARRGVSGLGLDRRALWLLPAFLLGAWGFVQAVPMPRAFVHVLSPKAAKLQAEAFGPEGQDGAQWLRQIEDDARARVPEAAGAVVPPTDALDLGADRPAPPRGFTLSLLPSATLERAFWYAALLLAFLLVHHRTANKDRAAVYRSTLYIGFTVLAFVSVLNRLTAPTRLLWLRDAPGDTHSFGPFVNPSHFAGVMELATPWLLGYGLAGLTQASGPGRIRTDRALAMFGAALCAAAAVLAASKMGAATIAVACAILVGVAIRASRRRTRAVLAAVTVAAALVIGGIATYGPLRGRLVEFAATHTGGPSQNVRAIGWSAAMRMAHDFPLTGSGFGAFGEVFFAYLPRGDSGIWNKLHNDYLELYVAGGAVAVALCAWLTVAFVWRAWRVSRIAAARGRLLSALGLALGLIALAVHELVDFNLQIPANALLFVVLAAICVSPLGRSVEGP